VSTGATYKEYKLDIQANQNNASIKYWLREQHNQNFDNSKSCMQSKSTMDKNLMRVKDEITKANGMQ